jgi:putative flippase GtrA
MFKLFMNNIFIRRFAGFSIIGLFNTVIHLFVVIGLVECLNFNTVLSNCVAFILANLFSFYANSRWNYRTAIAIRRYQRFLWVSLAGFIITASMSVLADRLGWHYLIGVAMIFVTLPFLTFLVHHRWTWRN